MSSWEQKMVPMPTKHAKFIIERNFTEDQMSSIMKGHAPLEMEDKWFSFYKDGKLYACRSWTGYCIYIICFNHSTNKHTIIANRDPNQFKRTDISKDTQTVNKLLDWWSRV